MDSTPSGNVYMESVTRRSQGSEREHGSYISNNQSNSAFVGDYVITEWETGYMVRDLAGHVFVS